ncbi:hypothetical protein BAUCODRAFT_29073 [Baudoinia panamericana UAMH 10762]|uniref:RIC1 C-terminal alpha solenoid region domain-containing protein n=1 Tax=Baudoinia panamericana (strain UAMH 10762) TaxID=717646 RepID=M2NNA8_BAUPA|nr:uncharacterized protein BAUCODRAFT_29073 [Baudoinia panamericana UAMH 10762]EMD00716.1 hypothetical protein BAUCODRAFT_29073 [Baudoinia panamericana UAMH 10762]
MYWPIGTPRVYSLTKHPRSLSNTLLSDDGLNSAEHHAQNGHANGSHLPADGRPKEREEDTLPQLERAADSSQGGEADLAKTGGDSTNVILGASISRSGDVVVTITGTTLTVWQAKPFVALAAAVRSPRSLKAYGPTCDLSLRPDGLTVVVQTTLGYLITYAITPDPYASVYQILFPDSHRRAQRSGNDAYTRRPSEAAADTAQGAGDSIHEVILRFRMVIRIDAGVSKLLALDNELVVATLKPAALQCIRWVAESGASQTSTQLLARMPWYNNEATVADMVHDRPMNLMCWVTSDGKAYAVQCKPAGSTGGGTTFEGFCFHTPDAASSAAVKVAINARFSLIAVGRSDCQIDIYAVKDYTGNVPLSHRVRLRGSDTHSGVITHLAYSPDGCSMFAGYQHGWAMWSVYGKTGASSFVADRMLSQANNELWLDGVKDAFWLGGGCELVTLSHYDDTITVQDIARNAAAAVLCPANTARGLLQSTDSISFYKGHEILDLTALSSEQSLWHTVRVPHQYLVSNWPIKLAVISSDSKYVAVAGRRGFAHYSVASGRWKAFEDSVKEQEFAVRGGMCWHQHFLIASMEGVSRYQIRVFSREKPLERTMHVEELNAPAILTTTSGSDSLLVYTYDNTLLHYIITFTNSSAKLVQVGQIGFHGIIRAPLRVRALSWLLPEAQLEHGDPSQDVATASVIFLVDGKLVLLQPSTNEYGELKYDMRVIAQNVEYYSLQRDLPDAVAALRAPNLLDGRPTGLLTGPLGHSLRDSLWYFDGECCQVWSDVQDVLASAPSDLGRDLPNTVRISMDFYPVSVLVNQGIVQGLDPDLVQRRDVNFSFFRLATRTQLFLPHLLRSHLADYNSPAALHLADSYKHLAYFSHALEILLHNVLDTEVDSPPLPPETALLPTVLSFLSSFSAYLDVIVNCTRKTELRSWRTLFSCLPPVQDLFEQSLERHKLKTAAGYLLVLHALEQEQEGFHVRKFATLLRQAAAEQDWDLCGEVARFLLGIDATGHTLSVALAAADLGNGRHGSIAGQLFNGSPPRAHANGQHMERSGDYFSGRQLG